NLERSAPRDVLKPTQEATADSNAYVIFTSGTTGKPKGVCVKHSGAASVVLTHTAVLNIAPASRVMSFMAIAFDVAVFEIFLALSTGATLVLRDDETLFATMATVTHLFITPTGLAQFEPAALRELECVMVAGEPCPQTLVDVWARPQDVDTAISRSMRRMFNGYGPTEASIISHSVELLAGKAVTIGRPVPNTWTYIVDEHMQRVPCGVAGKILIGGVGVASGYLNNGELTSAKFVDDPFKSEHVVYDTGDLGRWTMDGEIEYLGRMDDQVKVKGYRIELQEVVEALVKSNAGVNGAVVLVKENTLVAFVTPASVDVVALRAVVAKSLPRYMIPSVFVPMVEFPKNANGKADRAALLAMDVGMEVELPVTESQQRMAQIWSQILGVDIGSIGIQTSFFELGGDSISVIRLVTLCEERGFAITSQQVFRTPTVEALSVFTDRSVTLPHVEVRLVSESMLEEIHAQHLPTLGLRSNDVESIFPTTALQTGLLALMMKDPSAYAVQHMWELVGPVDMDRVASAFNALVRQHPILRTVFVPCSEGMVQIVVKEAGTISVEELEFYGGEDQVRSFLKEDSMRGFQITDRNLFRVALVKASAQADAAQHQHYLILTINHVLYDGWSLPLLVDDFKKAYNGVAFEARPSMLDFAKTLAQRDPAAAEAYWTRTLSDLEPCPSFAGSGPQAGVKRTETCIKTCSLTNTELASFTKRTGITVATALNAAWALTLQLYLGRTDVVFGNVYSGRDLPVKGIDRIIGMLINTVPVRVRMDPGMSIGALLNQLSRQYVDSLEHAHVGLSDIQSWIRLPAGTSLFNSLIVYENIPTSDGKIAISSDLCMRHIQSSGNASEFEIEVIVNPMEDRTEIAISYDATRMNGETVESVANAFDGILTSVVVGDASKTVSETARMSGAELAVIQPLE
ncbi:hypothetical protein HK102_007484, partial [Quaeritorhiza haematococci]